MKRLFHLKESSQLPAASLQRRKISGLADWRILSPISGSPLGEESNGGKQCQDKAFSWLLVAGSSF
jgi:hypothetical protein